VPKIGALILRTFALGKWKIRKVHLNETPPIVLVEIRLRIDDDSSSTA
jgi:hypothetical protein